MRASRARGTKMAVPAALLTLALAPAHLRAATIVVDSLADDNVAFDTFCTLREAITSANNDGSGLAEVAPPDCTDGSGADLITFDPSLTGTIQLASALPSLAADLEIRGPGADLLTVRRDTGGDYPIFDIPGGSTNVTLSGLTLSNGSGNQTLKIPSGGAISNAGILLVTDCVLSGNSATFGGAIYNEGVLTVERSTLSGNSAQDGGGIDTVSPGATTVRNSTLSGNFGAFGGGLNATGGSSGGAPSLLIESSTLAGNTAAVAGDAIYLLANSTGAAATISNSILESHATQSIFAPGGTTVTSLGHNLATDDVSAYLDQLSDLVPSDPRLGALASNGSPTPTRELLPGSPAIGAGDCTGGSISEDQRGAARPLGGSCDIGAFERAPLSLAGYWPLAEGGGAIAHDLSPAGLDGTISGASWTPDLGRGTALEFDGFEDFVAIPGGVAELNFEPFTITTWVRIDAGLAGGLLSKCNGDRSWAAGEKQLWFGDGSFGGDGARPSFVGYGDNYIISGNDVPTSGWHHLAIVWDPAAPALSKGVTSPERRVYIDGVEVPLTAASYIANVADNPGDTVFIGWDGSGEAQHDFLGRVAEVAIFDQALDGALVRRVMAGDYSESSDLLFADGFGLGTTGRWSE